MQFTDKATVLLKQLEGLRLNAYQDDAGIWTIGYGHTGKDVTPGALWTLDFAEQALQKDIAVHAAGVAAYLHPMRGLSDNQFSALVIFAYNVGLEALGGSTVLRHVNGGLESFVPDDLRKWNHIHKDGQLVIDPGLVRRREEEINLWNGV